MTKLRPLLLAALAALLPILPLHSQDPGGAAPVTIAVLPFDGANEKLQTRASEAAVLLGVHLSTNPQLWLVERAEIDKLLAEHTIKLSGLADPSTSAQIGKITGAKALVTGRLIQTGDTFILVAKIISTENSRVFGETVSLATTDGLDKPATELADKIGKVIAKQNGVFQPPVETYADRLKHWRELVKDKPHPSVQIQIAEQVLHRSVTDPAVQTELGKALLELGFEVVDEKQNAKPADIVISGEAFGESGARRGQLISARARTEIKITRRSDGRVLAVDRETSVAVDTAEATAAKSALEQCGRSLLDRILPKITAP